MKLKQGWETAGSHMAQAAAFVVIAAILLKQPPTNPS